VLSNIKAWAWRFAPMGRIKKKNKKRSRSDRLKKAGTSFFPLENCSQVVLLMVASSAQVPTELPDDELRPTHAAVKTEARAAYDFSHTVPNDGRVKRPQGVAIEKCVLVSGQGLPARGGPCFCCRPSQAASQQSENTCRGPWLGGGPPHCIIKKTQLPGPG